MDLKLYLALTGAVGLAYFSYSLLNKPRTIVIPKDLTKRICQQIKHQMMIAMKKLRDDNMQKMKGKIDQVFNQFRSQLSQVYVGKENLILRKYAVSREAYGKSLQKWKHDRSIVKNTDQILNMMQRAIQGQAPDFTVPTQVHAHFNRDSLCDIYKQMVTVIGKKVTHKLQIQSDKNPNFNSNKDDDFRNAIRELSIYDVKVEFLKQKGFKEEWGCPNEIFFKCLQSQKMKSQQYQKKVVAYEKCYEKIIELVSADPKAMSDSKIDQLFDRALVQQTQVSTNPQKVVQPIKVVSAQPPKVIKPEPKEEPLDEDASLQAMMMQQLLSRNGQQLKEQQKKEPFEEEASLQAMMMQQLLSRDGQQLKEQQKEQAAHLQSQCLGESTKIGLTQSEIQMDWQKNGDIREKPLTIMQEATEQIAVGIKDQSLIQAQQQVIEVALKQVQAQQKAHKQNQQQQNDKIALEEEIVALEEEENQKQQIRHSLQENQESELKNEGPVDGVNLEAENQSNQVPDENQAEPKQNFEQFEEPVQE